MWVGTTYYFTWLDGRFAELEKHMSKPPDQTPARDERIVWMVHSGGFYRVEKLRVPRVIPEKLHWFRWEAALTWLSGILLMALVYYHGGLMVDAIDPKVTLVQASFISIATLLVGWTVYDLLARPPLVTNEPVFAALGFLLTLVLAAALSRVLSSRAAYIHIGALFGTIMVSNVWMRILPPQRRMIAAAAKGEPFSEALSAGAKRRSKHNTFLAVPTTFIMVSNHFPTATYGSRYGVAVLGALILVGWGAAAILRRA